MERSDQIHELAAALATAQGAMAPAVKGKTASIRSNRAGSASYEYTFADLDAVWDACRGPLTAAGLAVVQVTEPDEAAGEVMLRTTLIHGSGQWISSRLPLIFDGASMQTLGSAITYARRYALAAMVGVTCEEDDDGARAKAPVPVASNGHAARRETGNGGHPRHDVSADQRDSIKRSSLPVVGLDRSKGLAPTNGRELLAWMSRQSRRWEYNIEAEVLAWGKSAGLGRRVIDWPVAAVTDGYKEACKILRGRRASSEGVPFADVSTFRIWLESSGSYDAAMAFGEDGRYPASTAMWSFDQAVACYRSLAEDMAETAARP